MRPYDWSCIWNMVLKIDEIAVGGMQSDIFEREKIGNTERVDCPRKNGANGSNAWLVRSFVFYQTPPNLALSLIIRPPNHLASNPIWDWEFSLLGKLVVGFVHCLLRLLAGASPISLLRAHFRIHSASAERNDEGHKEVQLSGCVNRPGEFCLGWHFEGQPPGMQRKTRQSRPKRVPMRWWMAPIRLCVFDVNS